MIAIIDRRTPTMEELMPTPKPPADPATATWLAELSRKAEEWNRDLWFTAQTLLPPDPKRSSKDERRMLGDIAQALFDKEMFGCAQRRK
jgi:hypothetical protein